MSGPLRAGCSRRGRTSQVERRGRTGLWLPRRRDVDGEADRVGRAGGLATGGVNEHPRSRRRAELAGARATVDGRQRGGETRVGGQRALGRFGMPLRSLSPPGPDGPVPFVVTSRGRSSRRSRSARHCSPTPSARRPTRWTEVAWQDARSPSTTERRRCRVQPLPSSRRSPSARCRRRPQDPRTGRTCGIRRLGGPATTQHDHPQSHVSETMALLATRKSRMR